MMSPEKKKDGHHAHLFLCDEWHVSIVDVMRRLADPKLALEMRAQRG